jgi:hypothetical protein
VAPVVEGRLLREHGRGVPTVAWGAARLIARDRAAAVDLDLAAADQQFSELTASALDSRFHPGGRQAEAGRRAGLGQPLELGQRDGLAVRRAKPLQQRPEARRELAAQLSRSGLGQRRLMAIEVDPCGLFSPDRRPPVVVGDRVAGDLVNPRTDRLRALELCAWRWMRSMTS